MIDRAPAVRRHIPIHTKIDLQSPFTVGNGEIAFTADVTGFQTLTADYLLFPLCTMSQWGWHTAPTGEEAVKYRLSDVEMTQYKSGQRTVNYPTRQHPGNEHIYDWCRHNPRRMNLARVSLLWDGRVIKAEELTRIRQELDIYSGTLMSDFTIEGERIRVRTVCSQSKDILGFSITVPQYTYERLSISLSFPYCTHKKSASDWKSPSLHKTSIHTDDDAIVFRRDIDRSSYYVRLCGHNIFKRTGEHNFEFKALEFTLAFFSDNAQTRRSVISKETFEIVHLDSIDGWEKFWNNGGFVDFSGAKDPRAFELERRVILSQYLTAAQCAGSMPPQETGLSCNSWYGKFHLEMHILHAGWFPLWGRKELLLRSFPWYKSILEKAKENASRNGYEGARWPKMTGPNGVDCPSPIAPLLIWQQPHLLYMSELINRENREDERYNFMQKYEEMLIETVRFIQSFMQKNNLVPPIMPAQEEFDPEYVINPTFELSYWKYGLKLAQDLIEDFDEVVGNVTMPAKPVPIDGLYPAYWDCLDTFTEYNRDHPSMLYAYGFIPNDDIDKDIMSATVDKVLECWDRKTLWGWDFPLIAMTLTRLGRQEDAIEVLLSQSDKNSYNLNGNNIQRGRTDLPLYLPGNGSLLFAMAMMLAGYGENKGITGFPKNGLWDDIIVEGISPLPY